MSNPPRVFVWVTIAEDCLLTGEFEAGDQEPDIKFQLGSPCDDTILVFKGAALSRFVELAQRMLAVPPGGSGNCPPVRMVASHGRDISAESALAPCG